jgi:hypothetical protein
MDPDPDPGGPKTCGSAFRNTGLEARESSTLCIVQETAVSIMAALTAWLILRLYDLQQAFFIERDLRSIRDTQKEGVEEKETSYQVHRI